MLLLLYEQLEGCDVFTHLHVDTPLLVLLPRVLSSSCSLHACHVPKHLCKCASLAQQLGQLGWGAVVSMTQPCQLRLTTVTSPIELVANNTNG